MCSDQRFKVFSKGKKSKKITLKNQNIFYLSDFYLSEESYCI